MINTSVCTTARDGCCLVPPAISPEGFTYYPNATDCGLTSHWHDERALPELVGNLGGVVILFVVKWVAAKANSRLSAREQKAHEESARRAVEEGRQPQPPPPKHGSGYALLLGPTALKGGTGDPMYHTKLVLAIGGFVAQMTTAIMYSFTMANSIQQNLGATERNVIGAVDSVITPFEIIFGSLEHYALVMASRSIMGGDAAAAGRLFYRTTMLAATCGVIGSLVGTLISFPHGWIEAIATPGMAVNERLYPDCSEIPSPGAIGPPAYAYYLLRMWKMPLLFVNGALNGFMIGGGMMIIQGYVASIEMAVTLLIWLGGLHHHGLNRLELLGAAHFAGSTFNLLVNVLLILANRGLRESMGISAPSASRRDQHTPLAEPSNHASNASSAAPPPSAASTAASSPGSTVDGSGSHQESPRSFFTQTCQVLIFQMAIYIPRLVGVYVSANEGVAVQYQIMALQSAGPSAGQAWVLATIYLSRIIGSAHLARRRYLSFAYMTAFQSCYVVLVAIVAGPVVFFTFATFEAYSRAQPACSFRYSEACAPAYEAILGGSNSLSSAFAAFAFLAPVDAMSAYLTAHLQVCLDFRFMALIGVASLVFVFTPAIGIVCAYARNDATAIAVAMWSPHFLLLPACVARLLYNLRRMSKGVDGPWTSAVIDQSAMSVETDVSLEVFHKPASIRASNALGGSANTNESTSEDAAPSTQSDASSGAETSAPPEISSAGLEGTKLSELPT